LAAHALRPGAHVFIVSNAFIAQLLYAALVEAGLTRAKAEGFRLVLLVGDMPYYGRFGFEPVPPGQITLPGPVDPARVLALELVPGALQAATGQVKGLAR
jgi:predicted N-acetyltransferase YhbS